MKQLRDHGIYNLPGSLRSVYFVPAEQDIYFLIDCEFGSRLPPRFSIDDKGNLFNWFKDFPVWTVDDLIDTGETHEDSSFSAVQDQIQPKVQIIN